MLARLRGQRHSARRIGQAAAPRRCMSWWAIGGWEAGKARLSAEPRNLTPLCSIGASATMLATARLGRHSAPSLQVHWARQTQGCAQRLRGRRILWQLHGGQQPRQRHGQCIVSCIASRAPRGARLEGPQQIEKGLPGQPRSMSVARPPKPPQRSDRDMRARARLRHCMFGLSPFRNISCAYAETWPPMSNLGPFSMQALGPIGSKPPLITMCLRPQICASTLYLADPSSARKNKAYQVVPCWPQNSAV